MVNKSFTLNIDGKAYQVNIPHPGTISIDGNLFTIDITDNGVQVGDECLAGSLSEDFAIVGGKLYEIEWQTSN